VIDVSDPTNLRQVGVAEADLEAQRIVVSGNYVFVAESKERVWAASGDDSRLEVFNVSNPAAPQSVGRYDSDKGFAFGVATSGNLAYVADSRSFNGMYPTVEGLVVLDVSDPLHPRRIGSLGRDIQVYSVAALGHHVLLGTDPGVVVLDSSDPANPRRIGSFGLGVALDIVIAGNFAYVSGGDGLHVIDFRRAANLHRVGRFTTGNLVEGVTVFGDHAYLATASTWDEQAQAETGGGLVVINIGDPANPRQVGRYDTMGEYAVDVSVAGDYAYLAGVSKGLKVIDVSEPANPVQVGSYSEVQNTYGVVVTGNLAYVAGQ